MNPPGTINPMSSSGIPGGTSLIESGNTLAAAGPKAMPGGVQPTVDVAGLASMALGSAAKGIGSSANLMGMIGNNPLHRGLDLGMTPGQAYQQTQDYFAGVGENIVGSIPGLNMLGLDKLTGALTRMMTKGKAMQRAAELAEAQRDMERKAMRDYQDSYAPDTFNSIF